MVPTTKIQIKPATLLSNTPPTTPHQLPGKLLVTELFFSVPLDHSSESSNVEKIRIFCRAVERFEKPIFSTTTTTTTTGLEKKKEKDKDKDKPYFVYVVGGPGFGCPPPQDLGVLVEEVLGRGYKLLLLDHRGMGLSTPVTAATLTHQHHSAADQAAYLKHFRADNAVRDLEAIRLCLTADYSVEQQKWSIMGSSYGGYVCLTYLSLYPEGLREAFPVVGLAPVTQKKPDEPVRRLMRKVEERNRKFYAKFPEDRERVKRIVGLLSKDKVELPSGGTLSAGRFLELGLHFGFHGGLDRVHDVVLRTNNDLDIFGFLTRPTLSIIENMAWFDDQPLYAVLHEPLYAQGEAPNWAFDRVIREFPSFNFNIDSPAKSNEEVFFTGEMVFKRDFEDHVELRRLAEVADLLATSNDWPHLYDVEQLRRNEVPVYAATSIEDMYVEYEFARETASLIKGCKVFVTNVLYHDAIRSKADQLVKALFALRDDTVD